MKICAIVVTFNRINFLERCLGALLSQIIPLDKIIVVDNCSTDNTIQVLKDRWLPLHKKIELVSLKENLGGAGGFYTGMSKGVEEKIFDYFWLMDDDGFPSKNCLEQLLPYAHNNRVVGPVVATDSCDDMLCFPVRIPGTVRILTTLTEFQEQFKNIVTDMLLPFNGTLIPSNIIKIIGFPRKEYFIWGDEIEYSLRIKKYKFEIATIPDAVFHHPRFSNAGTPMLFGKLRFNNPSQDLKLYCLVRNASKTYLDYKGPFYAFLFIMKVLWFYSFTRPNAKRFVIALHGVFDAISGNFKNHYKFLKK